MSEMKPMTVLIIEDDPMECLKFKECVVNMPEISIIGMTNSSYDGIRFAECYLPEAIILDLELHNGSGSGIHFLNELPNSMISNDPFIFVTTNITAKVVLGMAREAGVTWIFSKNQIDYSVAMVFDMALQLRKTKERANLGVSVKVDPETHIETLEEKRARMIKHIEHELDLLGVPRMLKGRVYLVEGIYFLAEVNLTDLKLRKDTVIEHLSKLYNRNGTAITRTMQTAIRNTWKRSLAEDLMMYYTDRVNYRTGIPTTNEFLRYYAKRIRKMI
jgi:hypothetical protein